MKSLRAGSVFTRDKGTTREGNEGSAPYSPWQPAQPSLNNTSPAPASFASTGSG